MDIVVLAGGISTERDVSITTGTEVMKALRRKGHRAVVLDVYFGYEGDISDVFEKESLLDEKVTSISRTDPDIEKIKAMRKGNPDRFLGPNVIEICEKADLVFIGLHGADGENGKLQAALDCFGIKYTGSGYLGSALGMDKAMSKKVFQSAGIPCADGFTLKKNSGEDGLDRVVFPCVVKPCCGGSSVGVSIVHEEKDYGKALEKAFNYEDEILVEEYIKGREFSVGVLGGTVLPVIEIIPNAEFYDYETKYQEGMASDVCPADLTEEETLRMQKIALKVYDTLKLGTYARIDFLMKENSDMYVLEVNTLPGMTPLSLIPQEARVYGIGYDELCERIVKSAVEKYGKESDDKMPGMTPSRMASVTGGIYTGPEEVKNTEITAITTDSRKITKGCMFIAIKGARSDGNAFRKQAFDDGAFIVMSEEPSEGTASEETSSSSEISSSSEDTASSDNFRGKPYIQVKNVYEAIKKLAKYYRCVLNVKVVGIVGSVGKTTTKEMTASVLSEKYVTLKTKGNFNNELGLPLTIFRLRRKHKMAVLEMGISDFGEMDTLSDIDTPDACVFTNIGYCHLDKLHDRDGVLRAKTEIFNHMKPGGAVILNGDDDKLMNLKAVGDLKAPVFYGTGENSQVRAGQIRTFGLDATEMNIHTPAGDFTAVVRAPGKHMVYAALAAAAVGIEEGLTIDEIKKGIEKYAPIGGRNNIIKSGSFTIIDDCYNASPLSVKEGIDILKSSKGRTIAVLGDMLELGENTVSLHKEVGQYAADRHVDILVTVGKLGKEIAGAAALESPDIKTESFDDVGQAELYLRDIISSGDTVLVKASHAMGFNKIVEELKGLKI